ncbi:hypothetical protein FACS189483_05970 [Spirochaetia bacterium]|nr:hypothetical protein FACS189483_05970 [Spirochaetia bacterium]
MLVSIVNSVYNIDLGRKGLATAGATEDGFVSYSSGMANALAVFKEVSDLQSADQAANDLETLILAEYAYLTEELRHCRPEETQVVTSMTAALASFDDALLALEAVQDPTVYLGAEKTWPHNPDYRYNDMPRDVFHIACHAHRTRLNTPLRVPGINTVERQVYEQRSVNMTVAQNAYLKKQKIALAE